MKKTSKWLLFIAVLLPISSIYAAALDELSGLLKSFSTYQASFKQQTLSEQGRVIQESNGRMQIKRPGKFRWESEHPTQQVLITNGQTLWIYDVDLQQVSQQKLSSRTSVDPAMLLSGSVKNLADTFQIASHTSNGKETFILLPKKQDLGFKQVKLVFSEKQLVAMVIINNLSQTSQFNFSHIRLNQPLADSLFNFKPPKGVDVISQ